MDLSPQRIFRCFARVSGQASAQEDEDLQGFYLIELVLACPITSSSLTDEDKSSIATLLLDEFHMRQGIAVLDDFQITVHLPDGTQVHEDTGELYFPIESICYCGKVQEADLESALGM